jgi:hypothetical protein
MVRELTPCFTSPAASSFASYLPPRRRFALPRVLPLALSPLGMSLARSVRLASFIRLKN